MTRIELTGWRHGANKVGADKLLAYDAGLGLSTGKKVVDGVMAGRATAFEVADAQHAERIVSQLNEMGFDARMTRE